jgi:hypothetical protein
MTVNHLPLAYKRRRRSLPAGGRRKLITRFSAFIHDIGTLPQSTLRGTWRLLLLSRPACSSPLRAPCCHIIQRHERTPAGRTAHGRNQDKPRVIVLFSTGHRETDLSTLLVSDGTTFRTDKYPCKLMCSSFQSTACINFVIVIWRGSIDFVYLSIYLSIYCILSC